MRLTVLLAGMIPALTAPAMAEDTALTAVISAQIDAFLADDMVTAFGYASPMIRDMFGSAENFGRMVRQGYPMVYRPTEVQFLGVKDLGSVLRQRVLIRDSGGATHLLDYDMIRVGTDWRINGVHLIEAPGIGV
ncbi:DUF4864 domain-containing protein [Palleronia caenipelagi]|uniref:DUF4864 domain-containing protein n=1 Tax=Palleronia caenipelagi TaxID=2489174 RepID=A0A547Q5T2_9RHOB|nr:DUF4864 domain-containing protein [Palleronia caenipelagi]TRD21729.1 DUF4864 domain-containing protein [Palleronia caenipelagi]